MKDRPMCKLGVSRRELVEKIERGALSDLPADDWEFAKCGRARVNHDYHIEVQDFLYSVPHALIRATVNVRVTARTVEVFHRGQRVAAHQRCNGAKAWHDPETIIHPGQFSMEIEVKFDGGLLSSDGGVLALRKVEQRLGSLIGLRRVLSIRATLLRSRTALPISFGFDC
jgi:hypothetical protein